MKFCTECGQKFAVKDKFCRECGAPRQAKAQAGAAPLAEMAAEIVPQITPEIVIEPVVTEIQAARTESRANLLKSPYVYGALAVILSVSAGAAWGISSQYSASSPIRVSDAAAVNVPVRLDEPAVTNPVEVEIKMPVKVMTEVVAKPVKIGAKESKPVITAAPKPVVDTETATYEIYYSQPGNTLGDALEQVIEAPVIPVVAAIEPAAQVQTKPVPAQAQMSLQSLIIELGDYHGETSGGVPHGKGRLESPEGYVYEGDWVKGAMTGRGVRKTTYEFDGSWERYEGDFQDGFFHGRGTMTASNGNFQIGKWVKGYMHGQGQSKFHFRDGSFEEYEGMFEDGVYHGYGQLLSRSGAIVLGKFANGMMPTDISPEIKAAASEPMSMVSMQTRGLQSE